MNREVFLKNFQEALAGKVSNHIIQENINYYNSYFNEQIRNGKTEDEIINMLGDPRLLAKTVEESNNFAYDEANTMDSNEKILNDEHKKIKIYIGIIVAIVIAVVVLILIAIFKLVSFFMPLILTVLAAGLVYKLISRLLDVK